MIPSIVGAHLLLGDNETKVSTFFPFRVAYFAVHTSTDGPPGAVYVAFSYRGEDLLVFTDTPGFELGYGMEENGRLFRDTRQFGVPNFSVPEFLGYPRFVERRQLEYFPVYVRADVEISEATPLTITRRGEPRTVQFMFWGERRVDA